MGLGQAKSTNRKGWPTEGQPIYTLLHIYANREVWGTQNMKVVLNLKMFVKLKCAFTQTK